MSIAGVFLISGVPTGEFKGSIELFLALFIIISLILLAIGLVLWDKRKTWVKRSQITIGKIVEISRRYARDDHSGRFPIYFPIISYYVNGNEFRREVEKGFSKRMEVGEEIQVRYKPEDPFQASLNENSIPIQNPNIFFILGTLMLIGVIAMYFLEK